MNVTIFITHVRNLRNGSYANGGGWAATPFGESYTIFPTKTVKADLSPVINIKTFLSVLVVDILFINAIEQNMALVAVGMYIKTSDSSFAHQM